MRGDELIVDYAGTSPTVGHGINVALNYTAGYTTYGCGVPRVSPAGPCRDATRQICPRDRERDRRLHPEREYPCRSVTGHLSGIPYPSAVSARAPDALPERVIAPGADALWDTQIFGEVPRTGSRFTYVWFSAGGTGALATKDGLSATAFPSGIAGVPAEVIEALSPVVVKRRELRRASGGAGEFRGGLGQTLELAVRGERPFMFSGLYERIDHPAPGLRGQPGGAGTLATNRRACAPRPACRCPRHRDHARAARGRRLRSAVAARSRPRARGTSGTATCRSSAPAPVTASRSTRSR